MAMYDFDIFDYDIPTTAKDRLSFHYPNLLNPNWKQHASVCDVCGAYFEDSTMVYDDETERCFCPYCLAPESHLIEVNNQLFDKIIKDAWDTYRCEDYSAPYEFLEEENEDSSRTDIALKAWEDLIKRN